MEYSMKNLDIILPCKKCRDNISLNFHFFQVMNFEVPSWCYILTGLFSPLLAKNNKEVTEIPSKVNQKLGTRLSISALFTADASSLPRMWSPQSEFQEDVSPGNVQPTPCPGTALLAGVLRATLLGDLLENCDVT